MQKNDEEETRESGMQKNRCVVWVDDAGGGNAG